MKRLLPSSILLLAAFTLTGCDPVQMYQPVTGGYLGARITPQSSWSARGSLSTPQNAVDGNFATTARAGGQGGGEIVIDLKEICLFQTVIIEHGKSEEGYARLVGVATSVDGRSFTDRYVGVGSRRVSILSLSAPVLARYVRLQAIKPGPEPWSLAEVYVQ